MTNGQSGDSERVDRLLRSQCQAVRWKAWGFIHPPTPLFPSLSLALDCSPFLSSFLSFIRVTCFGNLIVSFGSKIRKKSSQTEKQRRQTQTEDNKGKKPGIFLGKIMGSNDTLLPS